MNMVVCVLIIWYCLNFVEDNLYIIKINVKGIMKCYKSLFYLNVYVIFVLFFYKFMFLIFIKYGLKNNYSNSLYFKLDYKFLLNVYMYKEIKCYYVLIL